MVRLSVKRLKIIKTVNLYIGSMASGMAMAVIGPTLLDLQNIVHTDTKNIAFVYTARSNGYLFGSLFGGAIFDLSARKQLIMTMFNLFSFISMAAIPWSRKIGVLTPLMVLNGATLGAIDTGLNVCILRLWGKDSGPYYQALHFTYGLGGLIAPLIAAPFLDTSYHASSLPTTENQTLTYTSSSSLISNFSFTSSLLNQTLDFTSPSYLASNFSLNQNLRSSSSQTLDFTSPSSFSSNSSFTPSSSSILSFTESIPSITYVYSIIALVLLLTTILFFVTCLVAPFDVCGQEGGEAKTRPRTRMFVGGVVLLNFLLVFVDTGTEIGYAQMLTTYAVKGPLKLSSTTGSYMTSTFWGAFTLGRFSSIFLAMRFSNLSLLIGDLVVTSAGAAFLYLLAPTNEWALWTATALLGAGIASFFPAAVAWVEGYIDVTNKIVAVFAIGAAFGEMLLPFIVSTFIEEVPEVLTYVVIATCVLSVVLVLGMYSVFRRTQDKWVTEDIEDAKADGAATTTKI